MKITLRQRKKGNKISLYLEYYNNGNRDYEYLKLYLIPEPEKGKLTVQQNESNRKNLELAEAIKSKRHLEIQNGIYGFYDKEKMKGSFLKYFEQLSNKRDGSAGNLGNWKSTLKHLKTYADADTAFEQVNKAWLEGFKVYLKRAKLLAQRCIGKHAPVQYQKNRKSAAAKLEKITRPVMGGSVGYLASRSDRSHLINKLILLYLLYYRISWSIVTLKVNAKPKLLTHAGKQE